MTRLVRTFRVFCGERFPPYYALYAALWSTAAGVGAVGVGDARAGPGTPLLPAWVLAGNFAAVLLTALALRMVDDVKDLPHDRVSHPERPLPAGRIEVSLLLLAAGLCAGAALVLAALVGGGVACAVLAGAQFYGLLQWLLVARGFAGWRHPFLELALTYPVQIVISVFLFVSTAAHVELAQPARLPWLLLVFAGAFLQFEILRKTTMDARDTEGMYSSSVSIATCCALAVGSGALGVITWVGLAATSGALPDAPLPRLAFVAACAALAALPLVAVVPLLRGTRATAPALPSILLIAGLYVLITITPLIER